MAWNRPDSNQSSTIKRGDSSKSSAKKYVLIGLAIVALVIIIAVVFMSGDTNSPERVTDRKSTGIIKEVKPAPAPRAAAKEEAPAKPKEEHQIIGRKGLLIPTYGLKVHKDEQGFLRYESGQRVYDPNEPAEELQLVKGDPPIFKCHSDNQIAALLIHEPGEMIAEKTYSDSFVKQFNDSLSQPIEFSEDDSDYVREVKKMVKAARDDLYQAMNRGEDIVEIMNETRTDLRNLAIARMDMRREISKVENSEDSSPEDVGDIIQAANKILADKGIKTIDGEGFAKYSILLEKKRAEKAKAEETESENE